MPASSSSKPPKLSRPRQIGRRVALVVYFALLGSTAVTMLVELTQQVFFPEQPQQAPSFSSCPAGLRALHRSLNQARRAAQSKLAAEEGTANEEAALERYRAVLEPVWRYRQAVSSLCRAQPEYRRIFESLRRLRYAEEHAVRRQGAELVTLRRKVGRMLRQLE